MEDRFVEQFNLTEDGNVIGVGVLDGHGGNQAVDYLQSIIPTVLKEQYPKLGHDIEKYFKESFKIINEKLRERKIENQGACACIAIIREDEQNGSQKGS